MAYLKTLFSNALWLAVLYFGFCKGVEGAANVIIMMCWFIVILSPFMLMDSIAQSLAKKPSPKMRWLNDLTAGITVATLGWHGHLWLAGLYMLACCICHSVVQESAKLRAAAELKAMADA